MSSNLLDTSKIQTIEQVLELKRRFEIVMHIYEKHPPTNQTSRTNFNKIVEQYNQLLAAFPIQLKPILKPSQATPQTKPTPNTRMVEL